MTPIGGPDTTTFALTLQLLTRLEERIAEGQLPAPASIVRHGRSGALVRFASSSEAIVAKMAII